VVTRRLGADVKGLSNLRVGPAGGDEPKHVDFSGGETQRGGSLR
jgi:hypothetical protein